MVKKRISVSIEAGLIKDLDNITNNRSGFLQALLEGALAGWKTIMVPKGYQMTHAISGPPPPPPPKGASEEEERKWTEAYNARMKKRKIALTPEQIALKGATVGITNELSDLFVKIRESQEGFDSSIGHVRASQTELVKLKKADKDNSVK